MQWLVAQLRVDLGDLVSALQAETKDPTVKSLFMANDVVAEAKAS